MDGVNKEYRLFFPVKRLLAHRTKQPVFFFHTSLQHLPFKVAGIGILSWQIPLKMFCQVTDDQHQAESDQCCSIFRYEMIQNIVSDNTEDACSGVDVFLQNIRNLAGQQITQNSAAHTRDQTHKCDQQKLICIQKTDGCFHTEDCKCCKSEGVRQKQQVVVHNIGTAGDFFGNRMAVVEFPDDKYNHSSNG